MWHPRDLVDEGDSLRGTAGALRLAVDEQGISTPFFVMYGDSLLDVSIGEVTSAYRAEALPALMTVFRNEHRWEESNAVFDGHRVTRYEKLVSAPPRDMVYVDYGLLILDSAVIDEFVPPGEVVDLASVLGHLSSTARLAGFEASRRFYEIGSPQGLEALKTRSRNESRQSLNESHWESIGESRLGPEILRSSTSRGHRG